MSACSSLVIIVKDGDSRIVQFSHFSVKEFLTSDRLARSSKEEISRYYVPFEPAHTILAQACLGVLLQLGDDVGRDIINIFPLAKYAAEYWAAHAQLENVSSLLKDEIECLFDADKPHFAAWFSIQWPLWVAASPILPDLPNFTPTPIFYASFFGFYSLVEHLITRRPEDIHALGGFIGTPLHAAVNCGHVEVVLLLLTHIPVDTRSTWLNRTPLHCLAINGNVEIGHHLLNFGADVNARQEGDWTPIHLASCYGHPRFMRLLLDHGADPHVRNVNGETPYQMASSQQRQEIIQLLFEYGFKPEEE
jgi:hypothetical protein